MHDNVDTPRKHVKVYHQTRDGRDYHTISYRPIAGGRVRKTFADLAKAEAEADRLEAALEQGRTSVVATSPDDLTALASMAQMIPHVPVEQIVREVLERHLPGATGTQVMTRRACDEFLASRSNPEQYSWAHRETLKYHIGRFRDCFATRPLTALTKKHIEDYLAKIGGSPRTRKNHLSSITSLFRWAVTERYLPYNVPTAPECVAKPRVVRSEHAIFSPQEMIDFLAVAPTLFVPWLVIGAFAGVRDAERRRLPWKNWNQEGGKILLTTDITKTSRRRNVDVLPNLKKWLTLFCPDDLETLVMPLKEPHNRWGQIYTAAGLTWKANALRASFASYHLELFDNAALTAKIDGHSVNELQTSYTNIRGVTKATARQWFAIAPETVLNFCTRNKKPLPEWAALVNKPARK